MCISAPTNPDDPDAASLVDNSEAEVINVNNVNSDSIDGTTTKAPAECLLLSRRKKEIVSADCSEFHRSACIHRSPG